MPILDRCIRHVANLEYCLACTTAAALSRSDSKYPRNRFDGCLSMSASKSRALFTFEGASSSLQICKGLSIVVKDILRKRRLILASMQRVGWLFDVPLITIETANVLFAEVVKGKQHHEKAIGDVR